MEDREIIELYFARNERAIQETAAQYGKLCYHVVGRIVGDKQDAEECVNDAYWGVWRAIPPKRPNSLCAFLVRIARNIAIDRLKYRSADKRNAAALLSLEELETVIPDEAGLEEREDGEVGAWISEFLYQEPEEIRRLFIRKYWYFDSIAGLSRKFGYSETKIKSILFRTRNKLRGYLTEKGVSV